MVLARDTAVVRELMALYRGLPLSVALGGGRRARISKFLRLRDCPPCMGDLADRAEILKVSTQEMRDVAGDPTGSGMCRDAVR